MLLVIIGVFVPPNFLKVSLYFTTSNHASNTTKSVLADVPAAFNLKRTLFSAGETSIAVPVTSLWPILKK
ncbi:hypothetical protein D3C71_1617840 [compost metagenome]